MNTHDFLCLSILSYHNVFLDTDDVVTTLSAAGYPVVLLETVGLGQSEIEVSQSVDILILLLPPGGGDGTLVSESAW